MESPPNFPPDVPEFSSQQMEWQKTVMIVQARFFQMLVRRFCEAYPEKDIPENDIVGVLILKLSEPLRLMFDWENDEGMSSSDFEEQFGGEQGFGRLLEFALPGKSVDQILQECLNDVDQLSKSPFRGRLHRLRIHTSLAALMTIDSKSN